MRWLSGSRLELASRCVWPWSPGVEWRDESTPAGRLGTAFHSAIAQRAIPQRTMTDDEIMDKMELDAEQRVKLQRLLEICERDASGLLCADWDAEVPLEWHPMTDTARLLSRSGHRDYSDVTPGAITGTVDVIRIERDVVTVIDWKVSRPENNVSIQGHLQIQFYALAASRIWGVDNIRMIVAYVDEDVVRAEVKFSNREELKQLAEVIRAIDRGVRNGGQPTPGDWCSRCPARHVCPAMTEALEVFSVASATPHRVVTRLEEIASPDHAAWLLDVYERVSLASEDLCKMLQNYSDQHGGIVRSDGKRWARLEYSQEEIDLTNEARDIVESELPGATTASVTKASIKRAARAAGLPIASTEERVMQALRAVGAVNLVSRSRFTNR